MTILAACSFFVALFGLGGLFALKQREVTTGRVAMPALRSWADDRALSLKYQIAVLSNEISTWPAKISLIIRYLIHLSALELAKALRAGEMALHRLADRVSHKHHFERRETHSAFLKEVANGKLETREVEKEV